MGCDRDLTAAKINARRLWPMGSRGHAAGLINRGQLPVPAGCARGFFLENRDLTAGGINRGQD